MGVFAKVGGVGQKISRLASLAYSFPPKLIFLVETLDGILFHSPIVIPSVPIIRHFYCTTNSVRTPCTQSKTSISSPGLEVEPSLQTYGSSSE